MRITFLGGGNMANALIGGLLKRGFSATDLQAIEISVQGREKLAAEYGIVCHEAANEAALSCDVLLLAVKPQQMAAALQPITPLLQQQLIVSIAAGIRIEHLSAWLGGYRRLVRSMPNTPALIGAGITGLFADPSVEEKGRAQAETVLGAVGKTVWIDDENMMDAVTAVSGSGPAYVFYFIESLIQAGVELGFTPEQARIFAIETVVGSAALAAQSNEDINVLRTQVTSKGGTTEAALKTMEAEGLQASIVRAVRAAQERGRELGDLLGKG
jgi:pyrroline-5-carboxylate reductase